MKWCFKTPILLLFLNPIINASPVQYSMPDRNYGWCKSNDVCISNGHLRLATRAEVLTKRNGWKDLANHWTPVMDEFNAWVQIGHFDFWTEGANPKYGKYHHNHPDGLNLGKPAWGTENDHNPDRNKFYCSSDDEAMDESVVAGLEQQCRDDEAEKEEQQKLEDEQKAIEDQQKEEDRQKEEARKKADRKKKEDEKREADKIEAQKKEDDRKKEEEEEKRRQKKKDEDGFALLVLLIVFTGISICCSYALKCACWAEKKPTPIVNTQVIQQAAPPPPPPPQPMMQAAPAPMMAAPMMAAPMMAAPMMAAPMMQPMMQAPMMQPMMQPTMQAPQQAAPISITIANNNDNKN